LCKIDISTNCFGVFEKPLHPGEYFGIKNIKISIAHILYYTELLKTVRKYVSFVQYLIPTETNNVVKCRNNYFFVPGVTMREKKSGALSKVQKIKKRLSHSFGRLCKY